MNLSLLIILGLAISICALTVVDDCTPTKKRCAKSRTRGCSDTTSHCAPHFKYSACAAHQFYCEMVNNHRVCYDCPRPK